MGRDANREQRVCSRTTPVQFQAQPYGNLFSLDRYPSVPLVPG